MSRGKVRATAKIKERKGKYYAENAMKALQ